MLNDAYVQGQVSALAEIEKLAGVEFTEKLANKMGFAKKVKDKAGEIAGKVTKKVKSAVGDYKRDARIGVTGKHKTLGKVSPEVRKHHLKNFGKKTAIGIGTAGALGGAGYGAHKATED